MSAMDYFDQTLISDHYMDASCSWRLFKGICTFLQFGDAFFSISGLQHLVFLLCNKQYTGTNTGLDTDKLMTSAREVIRQMEHRTSVWNMHAAKRRIKYYKNYKPNLAYKIRYFDVGLNRWWYYKRHL